MLTPLVPSLLRLNPPPQRLYPPLPPASTLSLVCTLLSHKPILACLCPSPSSMPLPSSVSFSPSHASPPSPVCIPLLVCCIPLCLYLPFSYLQTRLSLVAAAVPFTRVYPYPSVCFRVSVSLFHPLPPAAQSTYLKSSPVPVPSPQHPLFSSPEPPVSLSCTHAPHYNRLALAAGLLFLTLVCTLKDPPGISLPRETPALP